MSTLNRLPKVGRIQKIAVPGCSLGYGVENFVTSKATTPNRGSHVICTLTVQFKILIPFVLSCELGVKQHIPLASNQVAGGVLALGRSIYSYIDRSTNKI